MFSRKYFAGAYFAPAFWPQAAPDLPSPDALRIYVYGKVGGPHLHGRVEDESHIHGKAPSLNKLFGKAMQ